MAMSKAFAKLACVVGAVAAVVVVSRVEAQTYAPAPTYPPPQPTYAPYGAPAPTYAQPYGQPNYAPPPTYYSPYGAPPPNYAQQAPKTLPYEEGDPVPPGYRPVEKPRVGLLIAGPIVFGVAYFPSLLVGSVGAANSSGDKSTGYEWLEVPVLGPFVAAAQFRSHDATPSLLLDGLMQVSGAAMLIAGITWTKMVLLRNDIAEVTILPTAGFKSEGVSLVGAF